MRLAIHIRVQFWAINTDFKVEDWLIKEICHHIMKISNR